MFTFLPAVIKGPLCPFASMLFAFLMTAVLSRGRRDLNAVLEASEADFSPFSSLVDICTSSFESCLLISLACLLIGLFGFLFVF